MHIKVLENYIYCYFNLQREKVEILILVFIPLSIFRFFSAVLKLFLQKLILIGFLTYIVLSPTLSEILLKF